MTTTQNFLCHSQDTTHYNISQESHKNLHRCQQGLSSATPVTADDWRMAKISFHIIIKLNHLHMIVCTAIRATSRTFLAAVSRILQ